MMTHDQFSPGCRSSHMITKATGRYRRRAFFTVFPTTGGRNALPTMAGEQRDDLGDDSRFAAKH
jgi:hypothetical protein